MEGKKEAEEVTEHKEDLGNYSDEYLLDELVRSAGNLALANSGQGPLTSVRFEKKVEECCQEILKRLKRKFVEVKPSVKKNDLNYACDNLSA